MKLGMFLSPGSYPSRPLHEVVEWYEQVVARAEDLGYEEIWCASHTNSSWARVASPSQFIARMLGLTRRIKFGTGAEIMYMHNPISLATRLAELDQISRGRMLFGFASGGPVTDMQLYGLPGVKAPELKATAREMLQEGIEIILNCWQPGGPQDFDGKYYKVRRPPGYDDQTNSQKGDYGWHLSPYGSYEDRIAIASLGSRSEGMRFAGERGFIPMSWTISAEYAALNWQAVAEGAKAAGRPIAPEKWRFSQMIYVAETEKEARDAVLNGFAGIYYTKMWKPIFDFNGAANFLMKRTGLPASPTPEELVDRGIWYVGTPDRVAAQIREQYEQWGPFGTILQVGLDYAGEGSAGWMRSMELLAGEVMPRLTDLTGAPVLAKGAA